MRSKTSIPKKLKMGRNNEKAVMKQTRKSLGHMSMLLLIIYACLVIYFVLFSDRLGRGQGYSTYRYNLIPFEEITRFVKYRTYVSLDAFLLNLFGNLLVFFPVGFLVPIWRTKKTGCIRMMSYTFLFSLGIETLQLITKVGVFDVDDLILNTLGGLIGWMGYQLVLKLFQKMRGTPKTKRKADDL